jgi:hypothetical protein
MSNGAATSVRVSAGSTATATLRVSDPRFCITGGAVLFDTASSLILPTANNKGALDAARQRLLNGPSGELLLVVGHTDEAGDPAINDPLSDRRARTALAVLEDRPDVWEQVFRTEVKTPDRPWGNADFNAMFREVNGRNGTSAEIANLRQISPAGETLRESLFRDYFQRLLGNPSVSASVNTLTPATLACGERHPLGSGTHAPSRRAEFFFYQGASSPAITCAEYPRWDMACVISPAAPISVTIGSIDTIRKGRVATVQVTVSPAPLPPGDSVTLELSTVRGSGEARFASNNAATLQITGSGPVRIRGITESSEIDNIRLSAAQTGTSTTLAQEDFTVVKAVSFFLKFEMWSKRTRGFEPLPDGLQVDLMAEQLGRDESITHETTDAQGRVFFNLDDVQTASGDATPDIYFLIHLGISFQDVDLPDEWSTNGWLATDGTAGVHPNFSGSQLGTPSSPLVFRVGLDFHVQLEYRVGGGSRAGSDDPAPKGVPIELMQDRSGTGLFPQSLGTFRTDGSGRVDDVVFDAEPNSTFFLRVTFEIEDPDINLKKARYSTVPFVPPIVDIVTPAGDSLEWDSNDSDANQNHFPNHRNTSIGTVAAPEVFRCTLNDRNVALHILKVLRELHVFLFEMTQGDWKGVEVAVTPTAPVTAFSWPVGRMQLKFPADRWDRETVMHEMAHQVMWQEVNYSTLGVAYEGLLGNLQLYHRADLLANPEHALIEGWAEFVEAIFEGSGTPPFSVSSPVDTSGTPVHGGLGPPPNNRGESVEGAVANGLYAMFENHVAARPSPSNARVPESVNGDVTATAPWIANSAVQDRFLSMIWRPLKDLRPLSNPTSTALFGTIGSRNPNYWHVLLPELQAFNMAMTAPTISTVETEVDRISPAWGSVAGGDDIVITGSNFIQRSTVTTGAVLETEVEIGGVPATSVGVNTRSRLTVGVPPHAVGRVDVTVRTPAGTATLPGAYEYLDDPLTVTGVNPASLPTCRPATLTITGLGFRPKPNSHVVLGTTAVGPNEYVVRSPTEIRVSQTPQLAAGTVQVAVSVPGQVDDSQVVNYVDAPCISMLSPMSGPVFGGYVVEIHGLNFPPDVIVGVDQTGVPANAVNLVLIEITMPAGTGPGLVEIEVMNPHLPSHLSDKAEFIYE